MRSPRSRAPNAASGDDPTWIAHFDEAYLADELAHCHRDLGQAEAAARCAEESLAGHPESRARRRPSDTSCWPPRRSSSARWNRACHTGLRAVELLGTLRSNRGAEYLDDFQQRLEPYRDEAVVWELGRGWSWRRREWMVCAPVNTRCARA